MPTITVVGSLNYDLVTINDRFPEAGETISAQQFETHCGGKGSNQALACCRLRSTDSIGNIKIKMIGCVGPDSFGEELKSALEEAGADISAIMTIPSEKGIQTGVATILVDSTNGQNRILVYPGANACLTEEQVLDQLIDKNNDTTPFKTDAVVLQNEIPVSIVRKVIQTLQDVAVSSKTTKPFIMYNPSPIDASFGTDLYQYVDCLIVNSTEAKAIVPEEVSKILTDDDNAEQALQAAEPIAKTLNLPKYLVITLGAAGCVYYINKQNGKPIHLPACKPPKPVIDTTGAGDTFLGGLTAQLTEGKTIEEALAVALKASSIAVTRKGAGSGIPLFKEL